MKNLIGFLILVVLLATVACQSTKDNFVKDVALPVISLNGTWKVCSSSYENLVKTAETDIQWKKIHVPGECMMQGFPIKHDQPFIYATEFDIPSDFKEKIIKVRFEGVYSYARVWVNDVYIRDHSGGFTAWECDVTSAVQSGQRAKMMVEVTDKADEISYASGYAKHQIGGILRNVSLMALPENYPVLLNVTTDLDENYQDATLIVAGETRIDGEGWALFIELSDSSQRKIELKSPETAIVGKNFRLENQVANPLKWEAEHPNLYQLTAKFQKDGEIVWQKRYFIGFREIEVVGNKFLINGRQVKLRGSCRHDIHPLLGRLTTPDYDLQDVLLARAANMNFIRTSHYPPNEKFLELCDKYGIYVEDETAVCFVGSHRTAEYQPGASENSADYTARYLSQLEEMVNNHRNHPSVIIWSIGNENEYGENFKKSYDWVKTNDPTRPVIFSYPGKVPDSIPNYDIISMHYPGTTGNMEQYGLKTVAFGHAKKPVLFDEWAHVACYNSETVKEDPHVRDFWGASLDTMWQKLFEADGGLGGAIWCMIDETFMLPPDLPGYNEWWGKIDKKIIPRNFTGHTIGYGEWGIVDTWRRKKPEFWNVKKAYSPVRILKTDNYEFTGNKAIEIPVLNRFDFTNLNELMLKLTVNNKMYPIRPADIPPHSKGIIKAAIEAWPADAPLTLDFMDSKGNLIDSWVLSPFHKQTLPEALPDSGVVELSDIETGYRMVCNRGLTLTIDKQSGLLSGFEASSGKKQFVGPFANIRILGEEIIYSSYWVNDLCREWQLTSLAVKKINTSVVADIEGKYAGKINARFKILVSPDGELNTTYSISGLPEGIIRETGIRFILGNDYDTLSWKRNAYWSVYPAGHLSEPEGQAPLFTRENNVYRTPPAKVWQFDKKSFFYNGTENETDDQLTNMARAAKENIFEYILKSQDKKTITVKANGDRSCRIEKSGNQILLHVNDFIDYPDISWGNFSRNKKLSENHSGKAIIVLQAD